MTIEIMERLRNETAVYHKEIEQNKYAAAIMNQSLTLEDYRNYLEKFYGFVEPAETQAAALLEAQQTGFDLGVRGKTALLERDLLFLGASEQELEKLPRCSELPDISTIPRLLGFFYVMEGSTLGGQMITKLLKKNLPVSPETGLEYFNAYGPDTKEQWAGFRQLLTEASAAHQADEQIVEAAKATFHLLGKWLELHTD
ncbi:biliverdin-producing heme oxygenase [Paenibacillus albidus]|uniref:Biliverdin-producing heme oxygenase n=2 Tax=Paenibacillus albidus TaxID=2041023 RepID=A0A917C1V6_9BACL|nr:biliverdin-producing heme oxygenase [Paenibacillus albidus]